MDSVSVGRQFDAPAATVRDATVDLEPFVRSAGFDEVAVDGDAIDVAKRVGPIRIELALAVVDDPASVLAYERREGIFDAMRTTYALSGRPDGTEMAATTDFALGLALVGGLLDATVIERQRRAELEAQLDYLESATR
jgi:hypothetical protein